MTLLEKQIGHNSWANRTWVRLLHANAVSDDFLRRRIAHILLGQRAWLQRIAGEDPDRDIWRLLTADELTSLHAEQDHAFRQLLEGDLTRVIPYVRFTGERYRSPIEDVLAHLALHGIHHRGQMSVRASQLGMTPPNVDYIQYCLTAGL